MQTVKLCFIAIKECRLKYFKYQTILSALMIYFTSNTLINWWLKKGKNE